MTSRNVTPEVDESERYSLFRLCECTACAGRGKRPASDFPAGTFPRPIPPGVDIRCEDCRGEGRTRELVATCGSPEALGVALVTLGREGEWGDCPIGILDTMGATGEKWLVRPWQASTRNVRDAAKLLRAQQRETA